MPLDLPPSQVAILCGLLDDWREGARRDLAHPKGVQDPELTRREAEVFERLALEVEQGRVLAPDDTARAAIKTAAEAYDEASDYAEIVAHHDALHGLLAALTLETA